jgi:hypothetical protein
VIARAGNAVVKTAASKKMRGRTRMAIEALGFESDASTSHYTNYENYKAAFSKNL